MTTCLKYALVVFLILVVFNIGAQTNSNSNNQAIVTIIGDPVQSRTANDFINTTPYSENNTSSIQQKAVQSNQTIEPTLENGFHIRFELSSDQYVNHGGTTPATLSTGNSSDGKTKKHGVSMAKRTFNLKKHIKRWLPSHKKRYHPHLCGSF